MTDEKKGMLAATVAFCIFGLSYLFSKTAMEVAEPMILLCVRFSVTFVLLNLLVACRVMKLHLKGKKLLGPILLGVVQPVLYFVFENYGLKYTTTSFTGIVSYISPIFTALLGVVLLREKPNWKQWVGIGLSIVGVLIVSLGSTGGVNTPIGCICLLAAYFLGSFYNILVRKLSRNFSAFELTYVMFTVGVVFFVALAFITHGSSTVPMITAALGNGKFIVSCLYLGGAASVGAYMLANYALARLPVTRASVFNSFSTIVSILSGVVILHDPFTWVSALAFVLILTGVWSVNHFAAKETAPAEN